MEISRSLDYSSGLARVVSIPSSRIFEACIERNTTFIRQFALPPNIEQTGASTGDGVTRQRAPVGNPLDDEQWSDSLSDPSVALNSWPRDGRCGKART